MAELFIVGAQRSGTTYLYNILDQHPQVCMAKPVRPEPKFFLNKDEFSKGKDYYESLYYGKRTKSHKYIGEKSTSYIESNEVAERIKSFYPDTKILIILREPVARAYSNYKFSVENGFENLSFIDAIDEESRRLKDVQYTVSVHPNAYKRRGHYMDYICDFDAAFSRSQIKIIIHEEFVSNINAIAELYSWLGVDASYRPASYKRKINNNTELNVDKLDMLEVKINLSKIFEGSNKKLEDYLGRRINAWKT